MYGRTVFMMTTRSERSAQSIERLSFLFLLQHQTAFCKDRKMETCAWKELVGSI